MTTSAPPPAPSPAPSPALARAAELYLDLHRNPELSGSEERTAARLAEWLTAAGYRVESGIGGHGVAGVLRNGPGPVVMLRSELDALPVEERTGLPYASTRTARTPDGRTVPVMHACGHDVHLACAAGAAAELAADAERWRGTVLVVGQPAEETLQGARAMLADGLYQRFEPPSVVLAQHTAPLPAGMVAHGEGPMTAGSVTLEVVIHGRGGHAAAPHLAVDPVVAAASVVLRLQSVVAQETSPAEQVVLSVGSLEAGSQANIIPDRATLRVTVRGFSEHVLERVTAAVRRIVHGQAAASGCPQEPTVRVVSRSGVNLPDLDLTAAVRAAHQEAFGARRVTGWPPALATDDFPLFGAAGLALHGVAGVRTAYWMLGMVGPEQWAATPGSTAAEKLAALPANHSPKFRPHARLTLQTGIAALVGAATSQLLPVDQSPAQRPCP
ncbi:amidohydrolase [Kitasatospora sp. MAP12-15]|uniref:amidohydrolase n=1 Tax=unclassified Kitasatospora TaxID=2633591 RepID=UPI002476A9D3|nr:amidohydrolase [Kitasatospora sp. MAP12-44]MDH6108744.1 amidohydrolase [Kitasatospora sp. MAP12-44]